MRSYGFKELPDFPYVQSAYAELLDAEYAPIHEIFFPESMIQMAQKVRSRVCLPRVCCLSPTALVRSIKRHCRS